MQIPTSSYFYPPIVEIDVSGNFWDTDDPGRIDELIWDGNDDPRFYAVVVYEPIQQTTEVQVALDPAELWLGTSPNPFNPETVIRYDLPKACPVTLRAFDLRGRLVRNLARGLLEDGGRHEQTWDGRDEAGAALPSGTYLLRLEAGTKVRSLRVYLIR